MVLAIDVFVEKKVCGNEDGDLLLWGSPRGVIDEDVDWGLKVSEFELQSSHFVLFRTDTPGKSMNPLYLSYGLYSTFIYKDVFDIK